jgi:hypothetical protein
MHVGVRVLVLLAALAEQLMMLAKQFQGGDPIAELEPRALALP